MSERCPIRSIDTQPDEVIIEASLPARCVSCIQKALVLNKARLAESSKRDTLLEELTAYHDDPAKSSISQWQLESMQAPDFSDERAAVITQRLAEPFKGQNTGTVYRTLQVSFDCPDN